MRLALALSCSLLLACTKMEDAGVPLTAAHEGGVHAQADLDGKVAVEPTPAAATPSPPDPTPPPPLEESTAEAPPIPPEGTPAESASTGVANLDDALPTAEPSDREAIAVLESLPPATHRPGSLGVDALPSRPSPPSPPAAPPPLAPIAASAPCEPGPDAGVLAASLQDLSLVQTWMEGQSFRAMVANRAGRTFVLDRGSVVGASGAKVIRIVPGEVTLAEVQFDLQGNAVIVQQSLRPPMPK